MGEELQRACKERDYKKVESILKQKDEIEAGDLGAAFSFLAGDDVALHWLVEITQARNFEDVHESFIQAGLLAAMHGQCQVTLSHCLKDESILKKLPQIADDLLDLIWICAELDYPESFEAVVESPSFAQVPLQRAEKLKNFFWLALVTYSRIKMVDKLASIPACKAILDTCLEPLWMDLVKMRPIGGIANFLERKWTTSLSRNALVKAAIKTAKSNDFAKFKTLVQDRRYDAIYQDGLISKGLTEKNARDLIARAEIISQGEPFAASRISDIAQRTLNVARAVEMAKPSTFAEFKALIMEPRYEPIYQAGSISKRLEEKQAAGLIEEALKLPLQESLIASRILGIACIALIGSDDFPIEPAIYAKISVDDWCRAFSRSLKLGQIENTVTVLMKWPEIVAKMDLKQRESLAFRSIKAAKVTPSHRAIAKALITAKTENNLVPFSQKFVKKCIALEFPNIDFADADANVLFAFLVDNVQEKLLEIFAVSECFDLLTNESLERPFAALIQIGKRKKETADHQLSIDLFSVNYDKIESFFQITTKIVQSSRFSQLFKSDPLTHQNPDLWALFLAASGMGYFFLAAHIHSSRKAELPSPILILAVEQTCSENSFFAFYQKINAVQFDRKPIPFPKHSSKREKGRLLDYFLNAEWLLRDFKSEKTKGILFTLVKLAHESGNQRAIKQFVAHSQGAISNFQ